MAKIYMTLYNQGDTVLYHDRKGIIVDCVNIEEKIYYKIQFDDRMDIIRDSPLITKVVGDDIFSQIEGEIQGETQIQEGKVDADVVDADDPEVPALSDVQLDPLVETGESQAEAPVISVEIAKTGVQTGLAAPETQDKATPQISDAERTDLEATELQSSEQEQVPEKLDTALSSTSRETPEVTEPQSTHILKSSRKLFTPEQIAKHMSIKENCAGKSIREICSIFSSNLLRKEEEDNHYNSNNSKTYVKYDLRPWHFGWKVEPPPPPPQPMVVETPPDPEPGSPDSLGSSLISDSSLVTIDSEIFE